MSKRKLIVILLLPLVVYACRKNAPVPALNPATSEVSGFTQYTIANGAHYCDKNTFKTVELKEVRFKVKFDSTAIYTTRIPSNQYDINKLYGFSEGNDHHQNSARIGWGWNNNALRLYAYVYNTGVMKFTEITTVSIEDTINCSILVSGDMYVFTVNGFQKKLARAGTSEIIEGYQLYPYFGGDEAAPHNIYISIMETK